MGKYLPDANFFIGKDIPEFPGYKIVEKIGSGQKGHVFKAHSERMNHDLACKVIPKANLKEETPDSPGWREEFLKPNILNSQLVVKIINAIEWPDKENNINCVALISDFIPGKNLKDHIAGKQYTVEIHFIERLLKDMMSLFYRMEQRGFFHGDLHDKNILVEDLTGQLGGEKYRFRVTDFGVTAASNDIQPQDDYEQLAFILQKLLSKVDFQRLNPRDKFVFNLLNNEFLARHFTEKDTTRDPLARYPSRLHEKLDQIDIDYNIRLAQDGQAKLLTPFDYLSCEQIGESQENFYNIPVHYLTVTLIREVLKSIEMWGRLHFLEEFSRREVQISSLVWDSLKHPRILKPQEPGTDSIKALISRLDKERGRIHNKHIQLIYKNPGIELSTESPVSYSRSDIDGKEYVEGREFKLENLGLAYLGAKHQDKFTFLDDVFNRRFGAVDNYPVQNLDELIGDYDLPSNNVIARKIREEPKNQEWGKQMLFELCSGDIFYIIELVGKMVFKAGGTQSISTNKYTPKIKNKTQIDAIREEAGIFLDNLSRIEGGKNLVKVVTAFGNVAHSYLRYKNSKNEANNPPYQASRIEPMEEPNFTPKAQEIYKNLLRYSLFIEDPRGKSIRRKVVPRLHLRRSLLPFFNLTFSTRDSLRLDNKYLELLFLDPVRFEKIKIKRNENQAENENNRELPFPGIGGDDDCQG
jgi:serine/threonine protein kinase